MCQRLQMHKLDLARIKGKGTFLCPECGAIISPNDTSEEIYSLIKPKVDNQILKELIIQCNLCGCRICLTGFALLKETKYGL